MPYIIPIRTQNTLLPQSQNMHNYRDPTPSHALHHKQRKKINHPIKTTELQKELHIQVPICHMAPRASVPQEC